MRYTVAREKQKGTAKAGTPETIAQGRKPGKEHTMKKTGTRKEEMANSSVKDRTVRDWAQLHLRSGLGAAEPNVDYISNNGMLLPVKRKH